MITVRCICKYCICTASQEYSSEFICKSVDQCCLLFIHLIIVRDDIASDSKSAEETAVTARHLICFFQNAFHIQIAISDFLCCQIYDLSVITAHLHLLCKNLCNFSSAASVLAADGNNRMFSHFTVLLSLHVRSVLS